MRKILIIIFLFVFPLAAYGADSSLPAPETVVSEFYAALKKTESQPLPQALRTLSAFLSRDMNALITSARNADEAYLKKYPADKGILGNGTCFFYGGGDCTFTSFKVLKGSRTGDLATVRVRLILTDTRPGYPPASWDNRVALKREKEKWVISDIEYFGSGASQVLKEAIDEARDAVQK